MRGWRPALKIAWRDALRSRVRTLLAVVMIALPVLAVTAASVVLGTAQVSGVEAAQRTMGGADAFLWSNSRAPVVQHPDPIDSGFGGGPITDERTTEADVMDVLGPDVELVPLGRGWTQARVGERLLGFGVTQVDLREPVTEGLFEVSAGRVPENDREIVVNAPMLAKGLAVGDELEVGGRTLTIVGSGRDGTKSQELVVAGPAVVGDTMLEREGWLVSGRPVTWADVLGLNQVGGVVASRAVLADPPDVSAIAADLGYDTGENEMIAVALLIAVMALLEVVLLAGPSFAVGARRQARTLALIAASGGTPAQGRRVVLSSGIVIGVLASAGGVVLGLAAGLALTPLAQRWSDDWFGPREVPWPWVAAIAAFGLAAAFLAAAVPAWIASRQDVVAVLAGRRGDRRPSAGTPLVGLALLGAGIGGSAYGAVNSDRDDGAYWIAAAAVLSVLGMILCVPVVVSLVARLSRGLPLTTRYAARDAARHRTRTVPAVAAVAATVAGVVALGIATSSDELQNELTYAPTLAIGTGSVRWYPSVLPHEKAPDPDPVWRQLEAAVREAAPGVNLRPVVGMPESLPDGRWVSWGFRAPGITDEPLLWSWSSAYGSSVLVGEDAAAFEGSHAFDDSVAEQVDQALAAGRAVVFASAPVEAEEVRARVDLYDTGEEANTVERYVFPATYVVVPDETAPAQALLPPALARTIGDPATVGISLTGDLSKDVETRLDEVIGGAVQDASVYVERGYERPDEMVVVLLVLFSLGAVLMLGGTLTATFLALADARPDLATLAAVGAAPRTRRRVAASYALVVGFVGALLGAAVGFIPGIAISRPLTTTGISGPGDPVGASALDVPWLFVIGLVVALPLLTAAVVGLTARSRLPLVARLS